MQCEEHIEYVNVIMTQWNVDSVCKAHWMFKFDDNAYIYKVCFYVRVYNIHGIFIRRGEYIECDNVAQCGRHKWSAGGEHFS